jgi:hypothetical protein
LGHPDNYIPANPMSTPASIVPEWYLLPYYAILRSVPNKLFILFCFLGFSHHVYCQIRALSTQGSKCTEDQGLMSGRSLSRLDVHDLVSKTKSNLPPVKNTEKFRALANGFFQI